VYSAEMWKIEVNLAVLI